MSTTATEAPNAAAHPRAAAGKRRHTRICPDFFFFFFAEGGSGLEELTRHDWT